MCGSCGCGSLGWPLRPRPGYGCLARLGQRHGLGGPAEGLFDQLLAAVYAGQADIDRVGLVLAAIGQRHAPSLGENAQGVLEAVGRGDGAAGEADDLVVDPQSAAVGVGRFQDVGDQHAALVVGRHPGAQRGMIDDPPAVQDAEEILDLVDGNGIAHVDAHAAPLVERAAAVDAHHLPLAVEQRAAGVAGIDRGVGLQAVGIFQERAVGELVAMHAGDDAAGDRGLEVGGQEEGIAHGEDPVAGPQAIAVAEFGMGEIVAAQHLDQGHVAGRIEPDDHGVVDPAVGHAALHGVAAGVRDVEVAQGVAVGRDDHAGTAPLPCRIEDRQHAAAGLGHDGDALRLGRQDLGGRRGGVGHGGGEKINCKLQIANCKLQIAGRSPTWSIIRNTAHTFLRPILGFAFRRRYQILDFRSPICNSS